MENRKKIQEELKGLESSLPGTNNPGPFSVPEGYFDTLAGNILARIKVDSMSAQDEIKNLSPLLASLDKKMPFEVPQGYFEETVGQSGLFYQDDPKSAILELVERVTPYEVPYDYFDELPGRILRKVKPAGKMVKMGRSWMKMSVAAVLLGIIMVSGLWFLNNSKNNTVTIAAQLKNVSNKELDEFLNNSAIVPTTESAETAVAAPEVKKLLNDVADKELEKFLSEIPSDDLYALN
jgi:hypothetical protein